MKSENKTKLFRFIVVFLIVYAVRVLIIPRIFYIMNPKGLSGAEAYLSALLQDGVFVIGSFFLDSKERIDDKQPNTIGLRKITFYLVLGTGVFYAFQFLANGILMVINQKENEEIAKNLSGRALILILLVQVVWAVFAEENWFRKSMITAFPFGNDIIKALLASVLFAMAHQTVEQKIHSFFLSLLLCYVFLSEDDIRPCLVVHGMYNLLGIIYSFVIFKKVGFSFKEVGLYSIWNTRANGVISICFAIVACSAVFMMLFFKRQKQLHSLP